MARRVRLAALLVLALLAAGTARGDGETASPAELRISVVPIVNQDGFLARLLADWAQARGITLRIRAVHGREVVADARAGRADLVITHFDFAGTQRLEQTGVLEAGAVVFANPIVLLAPPADPAGAADAATIEEAFDRLRRADACFVENDLAHVVTIGRTRWGEGGCLAREPPLRGIRAALVAVERGAYTLWGLHPFALTDLALTPIVFEDPRLLRALEAWPVAAAGARELAREALGVLLSEPVQRAIPSLRLRRFPERQSWWPAAAVAGTSSSE